MQKTLVALFWIALVMSSCKEVAFREAQPAGVASMKEVPAELRGMYRANSNKGDNDTLIIEAWGYHGRDKNDKDILGHNVIGDSLVVKYYQGYYFINFKVNNQWVLRLVRRKVNGNFDFLSIDIQDDAKRKEMVRKLGRKFNMKEIKNGDDTYYLINPTAAQLMQMIKDGYFTGFEFTKLKK